MSRVSHRDKKGIRIAYQLHKATMEENYNLEKMLEKIKRKKEKKKSYEIPEVIITDIDYEKEESEKEKQIVLREHSFLGKKRREGKWGDWAEKL